MAAVAERLLQVIDEGQRTATYKLALVLALIDACAEHAAADGSAPPELHTRQIAEHVIRIYYPQVRPYVAHRGTRLDPAADDIDGGAPDPAADDSGAPLRQITTKRSVTIRAIHRLHLIAGGATLPRAVAAHPDEYARCLDEVELNFARYPLLRFQVVGRSNLPFLYDVDWTESVTLASLHGADGGRMRFRPGAADEMVSLAPLIRPLVELHWVREVSRLNGLRREGDHLHEFLFGATRTTFPTGLRSGLVELQSGRCFYCGGRLGAQVDLDHFLPWSRWANDAVENLVAADRPCNSDKRDHLAGLGPVQRWADRLIADGPVLRELADAAGWESDPRRSANLARAGYAHLPQGTPLWFARRELRVEDLAPIHHRLAQLEV